jgi:hypothetical protein
MASPAAAQELVATVALKAKAGKWFSGMKARTALVSGNVNHVTHWGG